MGEVVVCRIYFTGCCFVGNGSICCPMRCLVLIMDCLSIQPGNVYCLSVCLSLSICLFVCPSVCLYVFCLSVHLSVCMSSVCLCLSGCLSVCSFVCLSVCLSMLYVYHTIGYATMYIYLFSLYIIIIIMAVWFPFQ